MEFWCLFFSTNWHDISSCLYGCHDRYIKYIQLFALDTNCCISFNACSAMNSPDNVTNGCEEPALNLCSGWQWSWYSKRTCVLMQIRNSDQIDLWNKKTSPGKMSSLIFFFYFCFLPLQSIFQTCGIHGTSVFESWAQSAYVIVLCFNVCPPFWRKFHS